MHSEQQSLSHTAQMTTMFRDVSRVHLRMKTAVKLGLTLVTGAILVASVLIIREIMAMQLGTTIRFQVDNNNGLLPMNMSDHYLNRRYFQIRSDDIIYDVASSNGRRRRSKIETRRLPLLIREHKKEDVVRCLDSLSVKRNQRPMTIAFIGDSTARQHYFSLIKSSVPDYDRRSQSRFNTKSAEKLIHHDMNLTSHLLNDLNLSFYWRNLINEEMLALFRRWASTNDDTQAPDIILFSATVHHVIPRNNITFKTYENLLENELAPLMKQSLAAHPHQELIWLKPSLTIQHHATSDNSLHQDKMKRYTDILPRIFKGSRIVFWDTINVIAEEYIRACTLTRYNRYDKIKYENCNDMIHTGMGAIALGTRLLLNHICESVFDADAPDLRF